jgi:cell division protein FtsL
MTTPAICIVCAHHARQCILALRRARAREQADKGWANMQACRLTGETRVQGGKIKTLSWESTRATLASASPLFTFSADALLSAVPLPAPEPLEDARTAGLLEPASPDPDPAHERARVGYQRVEVGRVRPATAFAPS